MMKRIDKIVIGELVEGVTLDMLVVCDDEVRLHITEDDARDMEFFLPKMLVSIGLFPSTTEIRHIQKVRNGMEHLPLDERNLWRNLTTPELTKFKIGKKLFWVVMGDCKN
mgnify:CR=1 FL=1